MENKQSKEELMAKARARMITKAGGEENFKKSMAETRSRIFSHKSKELTHKEKLHYQDRTGRAYSE